jgi:hypothetical protein
MTAPPFISDEITSESVLRRYRKSLSQIALVCIAYIVAGRLGLRVPFTGGNVSPGLARCWHCTRRELLASELAFSLLRMVQFTTRRRYIPSTIHSGS